MDEVLSRLQQWFSGQCNGDWEHGAAIRIEGLDNPGWTFRIDLTDTELEGKPFETIKHGLEDEASTDWHCLAVKGSTFEAFGDPSKLTFMLRTFLDWAERPSG